MIAHISDKKEEKQKMPSRNWPKMKHKVKVTDFVGELHKKRPEYSLFVDGSKN